MQLFSLYLFRENSSQFYPGLQDYMPTTKSWLDHAMMKYGGTYLDTDVEEVKTIGRIMIIFAIFIPYWTIYFQVIASYIIFKNILNCYCHKVVLKINC